MLVQHLLPRGDYQQSVNYNLISYHLHIKGAQWPRPSLTTQERALQHQCDICTPIFSFFPCVVYPVGVTMYWCSFLWIITNKFTNTYHILTKLGTTWHHLSVYQISGYLDNLFPLYSNVHTLMKRRKKTRKNEETKPIFKSLYLRNPWCDLVEIWNVGYWQQRVSSQQKSSGFVQAAWSYVYVKILLLFFLSIYSWVWCTSFLGHMTHTTVCLDSDQILQLQFWWLLQCFPVAQNAYFEIY